MKTIIAGVDFTRSSDNSANYAAMLAEKMHCNLVLFNMYDVPLIHSNSGLYFMSYDNVRQNSEHKLIKQCEKIQKQHPKVKVTTFVSTGFFKQQIASFIKSHSVVLVVMGLTAKDRFSKFIYGSHSTDIAGKLTTPVIIVPDNFKAHHLSNILLGVDNHEKLRKSSLTPFENFVKVTKAKPSLLHVKTEDEVFADKTINAIKINGKNLKVETLAATTAEKGIGDFTKKKKTDMVVIISKKHSAFYNLFNESNTKKVAFTSKVPVMAIHE